MKVFQKQLLNIIYKTSKNTESEKSIIKEIGKNYCGVFLETQEIRIPDTFKKILIKSVEIYRKIINNYAMRIEIREIEEEFVILLDTKDFVMKELFIGVLEGYIEISLRKCDIKSIKKGIKILEEKNFIYRIS